MSKIVEKRETGRWWHPLINSDAKRFCLPRSDMPIWWPKIFVSKKLGSNIQPIYAAQVAVYQVAWTSSFTMQRWCSLTLDFVQTALLSGSRVFKKRGRKLLFFFPTDLSAKDSASCIGGSKNNQQTHSILAGTGFPPGYLLPQWEEILSMAVIEMSPSLWLL